jgi:hypothetical protein
MFHKLKIILAGLAVAAPALAGMGDVVSSFDITAPGEGLAWDGQYLWTLGQPAVHIWRMTTTGSVVSSFKLTPASYGYYHGVTYDGQYLWTAWYRDFDPSSTLGKYTITGSRVGGFIAFATYAGLAWENGYLWHDNWKFTTAGSFVGSFKRPIILNDLAWDGHYLWSGRDENDYVYRVSTAGSIAASFLSPGGEASGMTFDGLYLWLVAKNGWAYQVDIDVKGVNPGSFGKIKGLYR